ncbi:Sphingosine kinase 2, partial [Dichanthelium oligosanthes]
MEDDRATACVRVDGAPAEATLGGGELRWRRAAGERALSLEREVLGVQARGKEVVVRAFVAAGAARVTSCAAAGAGAGGKGAGRRRCRRDFVLEMADGEGAAVEWAERLTRCLGSFGRPKRLFIFVNPFGGKKCAKKIYDAEIKPLFDAAGVSVTVQETEYQGHAREVASSLDFAKYDGIVCVSGDGVLVEVVNGILQRTDWEEAIKMPIGVVPAGTGNGMAKSLLHSANETCSISNSIFAIIKGHKQSLDVCTLSQGEKKFFSVLLMTWGLVADIDIESEKYRWMGSARFDFYVCTELFPFLSSSFFLAVLSSIISAVIRIMNLRKYFG